MMKALEIGLIITAIVMVNVATMYCCIKVSERSKDVKVTLTDIDGVKFEIYADMIDGIFKKGEYTEITTFIGETFTVRETVAEVISAKRGGTDMYYCELCGHIGGHARKCPNAPQDEPVDKCTECGEPLYNGDAVYIIGDMRLCDECINDCKVILDVDPYTYEDYLAERYEEERHDI